MIPKVWFPEVPFVVACRASITAEESSLMITEPRPHPVCEFTVANAVVLSANAASVESKTFFMLNPYFKIRNNYTI